jgi:oligoribonuclease (3'-5' exoribonuclease)
MKKLCPECESSLFNAGMGLCACQKCNWVGRFQDGITEPTVFKTSAPYVSIDLETTGKDPDFCQILEIGAVIEDWVSPLNDLPMFRRVFRIERIVGEPFALALNAKLLKEMDANTSEVASACDIALDFLHWLESHGIDPRNVQAAGKNFGTFDLQFLKKNAAFSHYIKFRHRVIDPAMLFWEPSDEGLPDSSTCYERAGMDKKVAHTALEDALAVVRLIRSGVKRMTDWTDVE